MIDFHKNYTRNQFKMQKNKNQIHCNGTFNTDRKIIQLSELQIKMLKAARSIQQLK